MHLLGISAAPWNALRLELLSSLQHLILSRAAVQRYKHTRLTINSQEHNFNPPPPENKTQPYKNAHYRQNRQCVRKCVGGMTAAITKFRLPSPVLWSCAGACTPSTLHEDGMYYAMCAATTAGSGIAMIRAVEDYTTIVSYWQHELSGLVAVDMTTLQATQRCRIYGPLLFLILILQ